MGLRSEIRVPAKNPIPDPGTKGKKGKAAITDPDP
jgi:hypothetical protein